MAFIVLRNCSLEEQRKVRFHELKTRLMERGYRSRSIDESISKVRTLRSEDVLDRIRSEEPQSNANCVSAVFKYAKRLPSLSSIMRNNWQTMVEDDTRLLEVFPEPPMVCYRLGRNVREVLGKTAP